MRDAVSAGWSLDATLLSQRSRVHVVPPPQVATFDPKGLAEFGRQNHPKSGRMCWTPGRT